MSRVPDPALLVAVTVCVLFAANPAQPASYDVGPGQPLVAMDRANKRAVRVR